MQIRFTRLLLIISLSLCPVVGCDSPAGDDPGTAATPAEPGAPAKAVQPEQNSKRFNLKGIIARHRERVRNAPGRTGILSEEKRYSLFDEELIIRDFFQDRREGFFVDVGCAWPVMGNNAFYLEKHLGWKGIGIDALAEHAPAWKEQRPNSKFFSYLVTDHSGTEDSFFKSESLGLSSADRERADGAHFGGTLRVEEVKVPSITLDDLLDREGVEKIDLLAMDIEGHELTALHAFDIDRFQPALVVTEGKRPDVRAYFAEHGYEVIDRYRPFDPVNEYYRRSDPLEQKDPKP